MKKNKKETVSTSPYVYFEKSEETVYRTDETQKQEIFKRLKKRKMKKQALNIISFVLAFAVLVSGFYVGKKGIEKFLVLRQEEKTHNESLLPDDVMKDLEGLSEEEKWAYLYDKYPELIDKLISLAFKRQRERENLMFTVNTNILNESSFGSKTKVGKI